MISFIPFKELHLPLMVKWLKQGESMRWYARHLQTDAEIIEKYRFRSNQEGVFCYIITIDGQAAGYIQVYFLDRFSDYFNLLNGKPGDFGLDLFIGEDSLLGKGLGTEIVAKALNDLVFSRSNVFRCLLGPDPENKRAIRVYEKCGFVFQQVVRTPEGNDEYVMVVANPKADAGK
ncbi:MAG: GNAT family N-acetyltransferase [Candidatus Rifleibacteriota bacterium]